MSKVVEKGEHYKKHLVFWCFFGKIKLSSEEIDLIARSGIVTLALDYSSRIIIVEVNKVESDNHIDGDYFNFVKNLDNLI